jgi:catalase
MNNLMNSNVFFSGMAFSMLASSGVLAQRPPVAPDQVVGKMEQLDGITPGARRNHIQGICASGSFVGSKVIKSYSSSTLFVGKPIPVVARFSMAGGSLKAPDTARSPRGMALEFDLSKIDRQHFTMLNVPIFGAATPESFYDAMVANTPDPATGKVDPDKVRAFKDGHPDAKPLSDFMSRSNPPVSYANSNFYSVHTFKFINKQMKSTLVRWRFEPQDGLKRLTDDDIKNSPSKFLDQALLDRIKQGPVRWNMVLTIGHPNDEQHNPTVYWPQNRKEIKAGVLTLTNATPQRGAPCEKVNFDPLVMADGIAPTDDPVLLFRSPAYAVSFAKRLTGQ